MQRALRVVPLGRVSTRGLASFQSRILTPRVGPSATWSKVSKVPSFSQVRACSSKTEGADKKVTKDDVDDDMVDEEKETETSEEKTKETLIPETEATKGESESFGFMTETRQLLDIVARSLYTEKEIFIRELISNASDALEKCRHLHLVSGTDLAEPEEEFQIKLAVDMAKKTFTIQDTGVGMTKDELLSCLGTIARSGSKAFMQKIAEEEMAQGDAAEAIIGQFGVGFYSSFMVSQHVKVYTKSCLKDSQGYLWESDGSGEFKITEAEGVAQGTKIILQLKETESTWASQSVVERVVKKYSNFIGFPITLNGSRLNTVDALWRKDVKNVSDEEHTDFFRFISATSETPQFKLHYKVDAPIHINSVLYVGASHSEKFGMARLEPNVSLYCRKVLIQPKCKTILPEWMRFIHGVVDSEDLPLNISRENTQDSAQVRRLNNVLAKRVIKWLVDEAKKDPEKYDNFFNEFGVFLKEGVCIDPVNKNDIGKLLRFESSKKGPGELISLDDYVERMAEGQEKIYFLHAPSRKTAEASPYYEQFKKKGIEVLFLHGNIDEYVMGHLGQYKTHSLYAIENPDVDLDKIKATEDAEPINADDMESLLTKEMSDEQCKEFSDWISQSALPGKLFEAKVSKRLSDSPAVIVTGHEQASMHRMMKQMAMMQGKTMDEVGLPPQLLEYNPKHIVIKKLHALSKSKTDIDKTHARYLAEQIFDNALIAAGLLDDPRRMLPRLNALLIKAVEQVQELPATEIPTLEEDKEEKKE